MKRKTENTGTKDVETMIPLKYLINCEISLQLKWCKDCFLVAGNAAKEVPEIKITLSLSVVTLSTQDNMKLFKQLEYDFKRAINWSKYQSKEKNQAQSRYWDFSIYLSFQGVDRLFVLSFKDKDDRQSYKHNYLPNVKIEKYNIAIDGRNFIDQPIKNDMITLERLQLVKVMITQLDVY